MTDHHHGRGHGGPSDRTPARGDLARGAGAGRLLYLDAASGVAGDMLVAALVDLGVPFGVIEGAVGAIGLEGAHLEVGSVVRSGIVGRTFRVQVQGEQPERTWRQIRALLEQSELTDGARRLALDAFRRLAEAEAAVHQQPVDHVHFHEVGAVDSIVDVVAAAAALDHLGARLVCSPLPMGHGTVKARHGVLPLPAPATVACLRGVPTYDGGVAAELVTPTGACLVATAAEAFARWPAMRPERVGWGGGSRELPDRPNLLRVVLGEPAEIDDAQPASEGFFVVATNLDDTSAEVAAYAVEGLLAVGALDAWTTAIGMKKGRPGITISALARAAEVDAVARVLLTETSTLGVRIQPARRIERPRRVVEVSTPYGTIPVKVADGDGLPRNVAPEFEACRAAAAQHDVPLKDVYAAAVRAATEP